MIEKIFYEEIIPECSKKTLSIGDFCPTVFFDTKILEDGINTSSCNKINPKPVLVINNKKEFLKVLEEYVYKGLDFYYNGIVSHDNIKSLIAYVFSNATTNDLDNPIAFLRLRKSFLDYEISDIKEKRNIFDYNGVIRINKLKPYLEAPYSFELEIIDEENRYILPNVIFGVSKDTAYVYAIQNKFLENNPLRKKINRMLFKINEGFIDESDSLVFNLKDVSMPFVAIVIVFIDYLKKIGIEKVIIPVNLPIRYNSHYESFERRLNYGINKYSDEEFTCYKEKLEKENKAYDDNTIMKLVRTFNRVSKQGNVLNIDRFPFTCGSELGLTINYEGYFNNDFCNELFHSIRKSK